MRSGHPAVYLKANNILRTSRSIAVPIGPDSMHMCYMPHCSITQSHALGVWGYCSRATYERTIFSSVWTEILEGCNNSHGWLKH